MKIAYVVLWYQLIFFADPKGPLVTQSWEPIRTFVSYKECQNDKKARLDKHETKAIKDGDFIKITVSESQIVLDGKLGDTYISKYLCLPSTIDPREKRGK